jgi:glycosyltransferase involved in cell wall biosynthesis
MNPFATIITVCYNSSATIERTILSVLNQTCNFFEYIIIDGKSTDGTLDIVKKYDEVFKNKGISFTWISEPDKGMYDAMNKGINIAKGEYIAILNSDDWYELNTIETVYNTYKENRDIDIFYGIVRYWKNNEILLIHCYGHNFLHEGMIPHPTCFISKDTYNKYGMYDLTYKSASDYDLLLRMKNCRFFLIQQILTNFSWGGISTTSLLNDIETLRIRKKNKSISAKNYYIPLKKLYIRNYLSKVKHRLLIFIHG